MKLLKSSNTENFKELKNFQAIDAGTIEIVEPRLIKYEGSFYHLEKSVAKTIMKQIGMNSEYFSRRLYKHDVEIWKSLLNKKLGEFGQEYLDSMQLYLLSEKVINIAPKQSEIYYPHIIDKIDDLDKDIYYQIQNGSVEYLIFKGNGRGLYVRLRIEKDYLEIYELYNKGTEEIIILSNPNFDDYLTAEFLDYLDFNELLDSLEESDLFEYKDEQIHQVLSLREVFDFFDSIDLLIKGRKLEKEIDDMNNIEKDHVTSLVSYMDEHFEDYSLTKGMNFLKKSITFTGYTAEDILKIYTDILLSENPESSITPRHIMKVSDKILNEELYKNYLN